MLGDDMRNQFNATAFSDIEAFDQGESNSCWLNLSNHLSSQAFDELMWNNKDEDVSILGCLHDIRNCNLKESAIDKVSAKYQRSFTCADRLKDLAKCQRR